MFLKKIYLSGAKNDSKASKNDVFIKYDIAAYV